MTDKSLTVVLPEGLRQLGDHALLMGPGSRVLLPASLEEIGTLPLNVAYWLTDDPLTDIRVFVPSSDAPAFQLLKEQGYSNLTVSGPGLLASKDSLYSLNEAGEATLWAWWDEAVEKEVKQEWQFPQMVNGSPIVEIADRAGIDLENVWTLRLPSTLRRVGSYAFKPELPLTLVLPEGMEQLGSRAFDLPHGSRALLPASLKEVGNHPLGSYLSGITVFVPASAPAFQQLKEQGYEDLRATGPNLHLNKNGVYSLNEAGEATLWEYWEEEWQWAWSFPQEVEGYSIVEIGDRAQINVEGKSKLELFPPLRRIGSSAFSRADALTVILPEGLRALGDNAFTLGSVGGGSSIVLPASLEEIGKLPLGEDFHGITVFIQPGTAAQARIIEEGYENIRAFSDENSGELLDESSDEEAPTVRVEASKTDINPGESITVRVEIEGGHGPFKVGYVCGVYVWEADETTRSISKISQEDVGEEFTVTPEGIGEGQIHIYVRDEIGRVYHSDDSDIIYFYIREGGGTAGWMQVDSKWYYFHQDGSKATGWLQVGDSWYYMSETGEMQTGWLQLGDSWYYLKRDGAMATGQYTIDGVVNVFSESGVWIGNQ